MAYQAEIQIGVKGLRDLRNAQARIERLSRQVEEANRKPLFNTPVVANLKTYNAVLAKANRTLAKTQIELDSAGNAVNDYKKAITNVVKAQADVNEAKLTTNNLLDQESQKLGLVTQKLEAYNAATAPARQVGSMAGAYLRPGEARLRGQTSDAGEALASAQNRLNVERGIGEVQEALRKLDEDSIRAHNARLDLQADYLTVLQRTADVAKFRANQPVQPAQLALPSSEMLKAAERGIKQIRSVTDQLGVDLNFNNQEVSNFVNGLKNGANEAVKLPKIFDIVNASLKEAVAATQKLKSPVQGPGNDQGVAAYKERVRLTKLANNLEQNFTKGINSLRVRQDAARYRLQKKRIKKLADLQKAADRQRNQRLESLALGVGFPALFGGGAGSILGSFGGSFVGSGFGGQILGGAIGQSIDQYVQGLTSLANSLESTTGILDGLEEAGFKVGAATRSVIESYQQAGLEAEAYGLALEEINRVLGPDGASKLSDYRIAKEELQGAFQEAKAALDAELLPALTGTIRLILGLKEAFDFVANSPLFKLFGGASNEAFKNLPGVGPLVSAFGALQDIGAPSGEVVVPEAQRLAQEDVRIKELTEQTEEITKQGAAQAKLDDATRRQNEALTAQIKIQKAGTDIKDENVFLARKEAIELKENNALIDAGTNSAAIRNAELTAELELLKLNNQRNAAFTRESEKANKENQKTAEAQRRILQASENAVAVQQNKLNLVKAEGPAAKALVQFAIRKTQVEQRYQKLVEEAKKIGGPSEQETLDNLEKERGLALSENQIRLENEIKQITEAALKPLNDKIQSYKDQVTFNEKYRDLVKNGINPELAKELAQIEVIFDKSLEILNVNITNLETEIERLKTQKGQADEAERQLEILKEQQRILEGKKKDAQDGATKAAESQPGKIEAHINKLKEELKDTQGMVVSLAQTIENEIGTAMSSAVTGVITGTTTVEEAMTTMFANIGKAFVDMATQMIAKALIMKALGILSSAFGGGGGGTTGPNVDLIGQYMYKGGPVKPNGTYIVGEQGPEVLTMGNQSGFVHRNTSEAMDRYRAGRSSSGGGGSLNVNYNVTQINGMNFVTEEQFRAGMTKAAKDGAKMGEAGTFKSMRNSRSNRARVGL